MFRFRLLLWLLLAAGCSFSPAQDPATEVALAGTEGRFTLRMWEKAEGVLPTSIRWITQTPNGYVWLASHDSLVRFDGTRAANAAGKTSPLPLPLQGLEVFGDQSGRVWCSTVKGRLFVYERDEWRELTEAQGWKAAPASSFSQSPTGELTVVAGGKLFTLKDERFVEATLPTMVDPKVTAAIFSQDGALWASIGRELWRREEAKWQRIKQAPASITLARSGQEGIWLATQTELRQYTKNGLQKTVVRPGDFLKETLRLLEDSEGNLWAGGLENGLRIWMRDGTILNPGKSAEVLRPQVACIFEDRERNILVGTTGAGLARFKPANFQLALGQTGSLSGSLINSVAAVGPGRILAGTEGNGLFLIEHGIATAQIVASDSSLGRKGRVTSLLRLRDGRVLAAVGTVGLFWIEGTNAVPISSPEPVAKLVRSLFEDASGTVWLGCEDGIFSYKGDEFSPLKTPPVTNVRGIAQDPAGTTWFVHDGGLSSVKGGVFTPFDSSALGGTLLSIACDESGALWVSVGGKGLARITVGKVFLYSAEQGLPLGSIGAIVFEKADVWLATERGLLRTTRASLDAVFEGRAKRLQYRFFNRGDGLASDLFRRACQPTFTREEDGRLWFATHKGVVAIHPEHITAPAFEVPAIIEEVRAERDLITVTAANRENIVIPAGTRHMTIRCSVPTLSKPEFMPIEYQMEGFDSRWYTTGTERVIRFYDLGPGKFRFLVRAIGADGKSVEPATSVGFTVLPLYWQTLWFRVLGGCGIAGIAGLAVWRRMKARIAYQESRLREQEERAALQAQLQQASQVEAIGRLAGGIAHDFNNLLTSILGNAELAHMEFGDNARLAPLLNDIVNAGGRARELVIQILTYSRKRPTSLAPLDLGPAIRDALMLLRSGIPATVRIDTHIPSELPLVLADSAQIQRIIVNLGTNAAQAFGPEGGHVHIRAGAFIADAAACATQPKLRPGTYVRIVVEDNGSGMDDKTLQSIFAPFFTTKGVGKGTGLGLAVVQGIVESHRGIITVESGLDKGTTFTIYLPVTTTESAAKTAEPSRSIASGNKERILVVDDEPAVLHIARRYLEMLDYTVDGYTEPAAALDAFTRSPTSYHLVLTDYSMPGINGVELAQRIRTIQPGIPIILCTGFGGAVDENAIRLVGIAELVNKPYQKQTIAAAIAKALAVPSGV